MREQLIAAQRLLQREDLLVSSWISRARALLLHSKNKSEWLTKMLTEDRFQKEIAKRTKDDTGSDEHDKLGFEAATKMLQELLGRLDLTDEYGASTITTEEAKRLMLDPMEGTLLMLLYQLEATKHPLQPSNSYLFTKVSGKFGLFVRIFSVEITDSFQHGSAQITAFFRDLNLLTEFEILEEMYLLQYADLFGYGVHLAPFTPEIEPRKKKYGEQEKDLDRVDLTHLVSVCSGMLITANVIIVRD